jgi:hypothetical protein
MIRKKHSSIQMNITKNWAKWVEKPQLKRKRLKQKPQVSFKQPRNALFFQRKSLHKSRLFFFCLSGSFLCR